MKQRLLVFLAVGLLGFIGTVGAVQQSWYVNYESAIEALDKNDFAEAEQLLRDLIEVKRVPVSNASTYGVWVTNYTPYYHLGRALVGQQRHEEARQAFQASLVWGTVKAEPEKLRYIERQFTSVITSR